MFQGTQGSHGYSLHIDMFTCLYTYICYGPPPNVDLFVGFNGICGVLCRLLCFVESSNKKVPYQVNILFQQEILFTSSSTLEIILGCFTVNVYLN